jgi:hypothetical protein
MTTWNYRIVRYRNNQGFGLHEVFTDDAGQPMAMTEDPISFATDAEEGAEGIIASLRTALADATNRPIFNEPEKGKWPGQLIDKDEEFDPIKGEIDWG